MEPGRTEKAVKQQISATGARKGKSTAFRKWIGKMAAPVISIFPVPGEAYFRSKGLHLKDHFAIAANPREANVLLCGDNMGEELSKHAAVAYLQMPRPRILIMSNHIKYKNLPQADLQVNYEEVKPAELKKQLTNMFANAFREDAVDFLPPFMQEEDEHTKTRAHEQEKDEHKSTRAQEHKSSGADEPEGHEHEGHDHGGHKNGEGHEDHEHGGHDHGGGGMGFMSMVKMTKDMPRATDGLPMERNQAAFGPFFPGLPGGLAFNFTLDGDTVVEIKAKRDLYKDHSELNSDAAEKIPYALEKLNPLAPATYHIAGKLLTGAYGKTLPYDFIHKLEKERILNHLNWLSTFGVLLGNQWIEAQACLHMKRLQQNYSSSKLYEFVKKVQKFWYLEKKLQHAGAIPENLLHHTSGPVARSAGLEKDLRSEDKNYSKLGFKSIVIKENNAWGRLKIRLMEIEQSLGLISQIEEMHVEGTSGSETGNKSYAALEGPAGIITAKLHRTDGKSAKIEITDASTVSLTLAEKSIMEMELSDALISIASLDINPFAINGFCIETKNKHHG